MGLHEDSSIGNGLMGSLHVQEEKTQDGLQVSKMNRIQVFACNKLQPSSCRLCTRPRGMGIVHTLCAREAFYLLVVLTWRNLQRLAVPLSTSFIGCHLTAWSLPCSRRYHWLGLT